MRRFISQEDMTSLYEHFAHKAVEEYNAKGEVPPQLLAVTLDEKPGSIQAVAMMPSGMVNSFYRNGATKDMLAQLMRMLLAEDSPVREQMKANDMPLPDVVVQISEIWMTHIQSKDPKEAQAEAERMSREGVSNQPNRQEAVMVALHTLDGSMLGHSMIENKKATYSPLAEGLTFGGRFAMTPEETPTKH